MFWLHHANVDRVWWAWQHKNPAKNFWTFAGGSVPSAWAFNETTTEPNGAGPPLFYNSSFVSVVLRARRVSTSFADFAPTQPTDLVVANARVQDVIDTQGGYYCYTYDNDVFG
jgi:tyrosinase